jgi:2-polyprenyl-6-methoxyphenol hydroxylase-like FAD-dependent oxidoreductase
MAAFQVIVIGAGLGGLTLAQSLRSSGVDVQVFERDKSPWDRAQGYRLHLDADALSAAHEVLTPELRAVFDATSQRTRPFTTILRKDLAVVKRLPTHDEHGEAAWPGSPFDSSSHCNVDRATLRQILLCGLDDVVHFGKRLVRYESHADGMTAHFADGTTAEGNVLVGADGIRSAVRAQRAPACQLMDSGVIAIYGRLPMAVARDTVPTETLEDIFTIASDDRKVFLGLGSVRFPMSPDQAAAKFSPTSNIRKQDDYCVCIVGARPEFFPTDVGTMRTATGAQLQQLAAQTLKDWPERAASVVRSGDPSSFFLVEMYTSVPCTLDAPTNVTLLGDAIHSMTPTLGRGANIAMRDGALLGRALRAVAQGSVPLGQALAVYERDMLRYGFDVVREAARIGQQRMAQNPLPA